MVDRDTPPAGEVPAAATLVLVLGGARSGKSAVAERLVLDLAGTDRPHYLATAVVDGADADFAARVALHRHRRAGRFRSVEAGGDLTGALRALAPGPALVDSLGTWLASPAVTPTWAGGTGTPFDALVTDLVAVLTARASPTVVVSEEAGLGVHPEHDAGRRWRDALGLVNQRVAAAAGDVWLVVAGRLLALTRPGAGPRGGGA